MRCKATQLTDIPDLTYPHGLAYTEVTEVVILKQVIGLPPRVVAQGVPGDGLPLEDISVQIMLCDSGGTEVLRLG